MKRHTCDQGFARAVLRFIVLSLICTVIPLGGNAYADSADDMDLSREQFQQAIVSGDVQRARRILNGLADGISRTVVFSSYNARFISMRKLESQNNAAAYERMARFLSSINANTLFNSDWNSAAPANLAMSGKVNDDMTSQPLAGVKVVVAGHETTTDANGAFSLTGLPEGTFDLYVFAPGFSSFGGSWIIRAGADDRPQAFALHNKAPKKKVVGTETIEGSVVDAQSGEPIDGAVIMIAPVKGDLSSVKTAKSDSQGHFTLTGVHARISDISIQPENIRYHLPFGQRVNISGGGKTHRVVWKLERPK